MLDVIATLCLLSAPEVCEERLVQVGDAGCVAALSAAGPRLDAWADRYIVMDVACADPSRSALEVTEVASGLFVHTGRIAEPGAENLGDVSNFSIIIGSEGAAVVDTGGSRVIGERIVATVRSLTDLPIMAVVLTHMHPDHVLGATALVDAGAEVWGHSALPLALAGRAESYERALARLVGPASIGSETPTPRRLVDDVGAIDLGGRVLRLRAWPAAHTPTDLTVWDENTEILLAGDLVFDVHAPALDGSLVGWQSVLEELDEMVPKRVVPGHGAASLPWPEGGAPLSRYLELLAGETRAAIDEGLTLGEAVSSVARSDADAWELFDLYNPRNVTVAYTELEWE